MSPMISFIIYVLTFAAGNSYAVFILNKKRRELDLTKPEDAKKDKNLKLITLILPIETIILTVVFYFVFLGNDA